MKTILQIIWSDFKSVCRNPVAIIIFIGIMVLPSLYAWFNILSNWNPYDNTDKLKIAVSSNDLGASISDVYPEINDFEHIDDLSFDVNDNSINAGDLVVDNLRENNDINWIFVDSDEAIAGVEDGTYYAAVIVPESFSQDLLSVFDIDMHKAKIEYYVNEKKNAIATKITSTVISKVQREVNEAFVSAVSEVTFEILNDASVLFDDLEDSTLDIKNNILEALDDMIESLDNLKTTSNVVNSLLISTKSTVNVLDGLLIPLKDDLQKISDNSTDAGVLSKNLSEFGVVLKRSVGLALDSVDAVDDALDEQLDMTKDYVNNSDGKKSVERSLNNITDMINSNIKTLTNLQDTIESLHLLPTNLKNQLISYIDDIITPQKNLQKSVKNLKEDYISYGDFTDRNWKDAKNILDDLDNSVKLTRNYYNNIISPKVNTSLDNLTATFNNVPNSVNNTITAIDSVDVLLDSIIELLDNQINSHDDMQKLLDNGGKYAQNVIDNINDIGDYNRSSSLKNLLANDPEDFASFVSAPVDIETISLYPVENYGSAMAPFYTILAIWVGGLILVAVLKTNIADPRFVEAKLWQQFFGRYFTFLTLSIGQGLIVALGDIYLLKIQCLNQPLFVFTCVLASIVFTTIIYSLTVVMDDIGKAIAIIILILQVAGSGGTFPNEILPDFFTKVNYWLPFSYGINALRECVAGFYDNLYWQNMKVLTYYFLPAIFLGILLWRRLYKTKNYLKEKLEETGIM